MKLLKGINRDVDPIDQPEQTYRDAENIIVNKRLGALSTEEGNVLANSIPNQNLVILGHSYIYDGRVVLFMSDGTDSIIGEFDISDNSYKKLVDDRELNFDQVLAEDGYIDTTNSINGDEDAVVYWTDDINPPRFLDIDEINPGNYSDISELEIFPNINNSTSIDLNEVQQTGGALETGSYYFALAYIDEDETVTNFVSVTAPINITDDLYTVTGDATDGAKGGTATSRSIDLNLNELDTTYERILLVAIPKIGGIIQTPEILPEIRFTQSQINYTYTGQETIEEGSLDEVIIDNVRYEAAKTIEQLDGVLYMGNLESAPDVGYQKFANNIKVEASTKKFDFVNGEDTHKNETFVYLNKSFQRDEVYAFYVSFVLKDGSETHAYHIPGRAPNSGETDLVSSLSGPYVSEITDIDPDAEKFQFLNTTDGTGMQYWENKQEQYLDNQDFDVYDVDSNGDPVDPNNPNGGANLGNTTLRNKQVRHHHFPPLEDEPMYNDDQSSKGTLLGVRFKDVKIPSSIVDKVHGIKFYYAKRTDQNRRIFDQAMLTPMEVDSNDFLVNSLYRTNSAELSKDTDIMSARPFRMMRERENIGSLTHIKPQGGLRIGESLTKFHDMSVTKDDNFSVPDADKIRRLKAKAYVPSHRDEVELATRGFDNNANTFKEESKIVFKTFNSIELGKVSTNNVYHYHYLSNLCAHKRDVYNSFDQQELIWTGIYETEIDRFDPSTSYSADSDAGKASGSMEVTSAGTSSDGSPATASLTIEHNNVGENTNHTADIVVTESYSTGTQIDVTGYIDGMQGTTQTTVIDPGPAELAQAFADSLNSISEWNASRSYDGVDYHVEVNNDTTYYSADPVLVEGYTNESGDTDTPANPWSQNTTVTFSTFDSNASSTYEAFIDAYSTATVTVNYGESTSTVAQKFVDAINNDSYLSDHFTASLSGSTINIQTDTNTDQWNGDTFKLTHFGGEDKVTRTEGTVTGGAGPETLYIGINFNAPIFERGSYYGEYTIDGGQTTSEIVADLVASIQTDSNVTDNYEIIANSPYVEFLSTGYSADYNGTFSQVDVSNLSQVTTTDIGVGDGEQNTAVGNVVDLVAAGADLSQDFELTEELTATLGMNWMEITLQQSPSGEDNWTDVYSAYRHDPAGEWESDDDVADSQNSEDYSNTFTTTGITERYVRVWTKAEGSVGEGGADGTATITVAQTTNKDSGGITLSDANLTGGDASLREALAYESVGIYNGDTFMGMYGERMTKNDNSEKQILYYPIESMDNIGLRHQGITYGEVYYPKTDKTTVLELESNDEAPDDETWYDNIYLYNDDYSAQAEIKSTFPYPKNYDPKLNHPTRVIRSQSSSVDELATGNFRTFLSEDYMDLPRMRGELVKLSSTNSNILIPHMKRGIFRTKGREEMVTGDIRAFIGAGDIFSTNPDELRYTEEGYGGLQDMQTALTTPYGYFFVDRDAYKVFLLGQQLDPISDKGLRNFFEEELSNFDVANDRLQAVWDDKWDRVLLTYIDGSDATQSWTLSYYPRMQVWGSFHSYTPEYMFSGLTTFYSIISNSLDNRKDIYEHNIESNPGNFYGNNQVSIIDFVDNRGQKTSKHVMNIQFITEVESATSDEKFYRETFDHFQIRNAYQDTGEKDIVYFTGVDGNARHVEGTWKINKFRDMIDHSTGNIDLNKPWYEQGHLIGKYTQVKLIYDNVDNKFLHLYDASVGVKQSVR